MAAATSSSSQIVQYVIVRGDLLKACKWPVGALIAQACHATSAVLHLYYDDVYTQKYLKDLDRMHKVILEAPDESSLWKLSNELETNEIYHKIWIEQPENFPTCIACKPYPKTEVQKYFKQFKLFK
ncbi:putative peptidyl-tRNA hydrolase PTRHD1 [Argiope bruennichi]|uniref:putative peptidyl-tRNA hydrolase PTRHD1 n=1 Tax=Argiope bruennichi TaxID=94029 RepID=UPI0024948E7B|nr:putative peptidyl-tRNA hydrolase PTRHD1 [Argiope bruennichi]